MRALYFDCFSGISGNMTIAALLELGADFEVLKRELSKLDLGEYELVLDRAIKHGISGTHFEVRVGGVPVEEIGGSDHDHHDYHHDHDHHDHHHDHDHGHGYDHEHHHDHVHRNIYDIERMINESGLSDFVKDLSKKLFGFVARAEQKIHDVPMEELHFHEVGAIDSIIDIVGTAILVENLGITEFYASNVNLGTGFVKCAHGIMPVPAPATLEIAREGNLSVYSESTIGELTTPTGAAILAGLDCKFIGFPEMKIEKIGYGAGSKDFEIPNLLRLCLGDVKKKI